MLWLGKPRMMQIQRKSSDSPFGFSFTGICFDEILYDYGSCDEDFSLVLGLVNDVQSTLNQPGVHQLLHRFG